VPYRKRRRKIDRVLYPLFNKDLQVRDGRARQIPIQGAPVDIDPQFHLYVITEVKTPMFSPDVAVYANFVNFSVTREGLEAQLLSVIVGDRMAELEGKF
jgi:hypothetical protein